MCSTPGGASEKLGRTNLAVSGILTDYKELSVNNSIWMPWDTNVANIRDNVAPALVSNETGEVHAYVTLIHMLHTLHPVVFSALGEQTLHFVLSSIPAPISALGLSLTGFC